MTAALTILLAAAGAFVARSVTARRIEHPPAELVRVNFRGAMIPAVLGEGVVFGGAIGCGLLALLLALDLDLATSHSFTTAVLLLIAAMGGAGSWDDHRGDESDRGFRGHLAALRSGRVTGGIVKIMLGGLAGLAAGWVVSGSEPAEALRIGMTVALTANLVNLMDRAPGRALKTSGLLAVIAAPISAAAWLLPAAATLGSSSAVASLDLKERGMLGDSGANSLGAIVGLGLSAGAAAATGWMIVVVLAALNLASERWSFSAIIEKVPVLKWLDMAGRESSS